MYHNPKNMLFIMYPYHGNLNEVPCQQPRLGYSRSFIWTSSGSLTNSLAGDGPSQKNKRTDQSVASCVRKLQRI